VTLRFCSRVGVIELSDDVLATFNRHRQTKFWSKEAGGQLFYREVAGKACVEYATEPGQGDRRSRFAFWPARQKEQKEINQLFAKGLHYVGDWHTHPEDSPSPSGDDTSKMMGIFKKSEHVLAGMLMVIVGRKATPDSIWCGLVGKRGVQRLAVARKSSEQNAAP